MERLNRHATPTPNNEPVNRRKPAVVAPGQQNQTHNSMRPISLIEVPHPTPNIKPLVGRNLWVRNP